jgi:hypothetical protein
MEYYQKPERLRSRRPEAVRKSLHAVTRNRPVVALGDLHRKAATITNDRSKDNREGDICGGE